jgi:hypothetical protein
MTENETVVITLPEGYELIMNDKSDKETEDITQEYITLAKRVLRGINEKSLGKLLVQSTPIVVPGFTHDFMLLPPDEDYPDCVCVFEPTVDEKYFSNDKKRNQRTGHKMILRPEIKSSVEFFNEITKTVRQKRSKLFISSAGVTSSAEALEAVHVLCEEFLDVVSEVDISPWSPEELFLKILHERDRFERLLIKTPSTPAKTKNVAKERINARARLYGEWRMSKPLFNVSYRAMYELVDEFEGIIAADLIERHIDNNKVYNYYVGVNEY